MKYLIWFAGLATLPQITHAQTPDIFDEASISPPTQTLANPKAESTTYSSASRKHPGDYVVTFANKNDQVEGFFFANFGPNSTIPVPSRGIGMGPGRDFTFEFPDRASQDIKLAVVDQPDDRISNLMNSYFYFFPRKILPAIHWPEDGSSVFKVILPTEETVLFNTKTKEMVGGVLKETAPIDLNRDRNLRKFPAIEYSGTGVMIRVNKRGADPRLGTTAIISQGDKTCKVPSSKLFDQNPRGAVLFLFPTDAEFNEFLKKTCKMSLP